MPTSARQNMAVFTEIYGEFAASQRADVGIGPYMSRTSASNKVNQSL